MTNDIANIDGRMATANSTFAKWRVEEVLVRSVFNPTFVACRQVEAPNPPIRKSAKRWYAII